jgi:hypothetical protein
VEELENEGDLLILVTDYLKGLNPNKNVINGIIRSGVRTQTVVAITWLTKSR